MIKRVIRAVLIGVGAFLLAAAMLLTALRKMGLLDQNYLP